jgi:hypothetical protein
LRPWRLREEADYERSVRSTRSLGSRQGAELKTNRLTLS